MKVTDRLVRLCACAALAAGLAACSNSPSSKIGLIDTARITSNWPKFQNYQNQITADEAAIQRQNVPRAQKVQEVAALQQRYASAQRELTDDVSDAAAQVAKARGLSYVLTRQFVGYGGIDVTPDVEKILKIDEKATPAP